MLPRKWPHFPFISCCVLADALEQYKFSPWTWWQKCSYMCVFYWQDHHGNLSIWSSKWSRWLQDMYIDFSMKFTVYAISIKVAQHKLTNPFMGFDSAATKSGKPVLADGAWTKAAEVASPTAQVAFPAVSRSSWLVKGSSGVAFHSCFIHLLITFCQILWGWNFLSGAGPCMPKGKIFLESFCQSY